jgi:hypothetical protein
MLKNDLGLCVRAALASLLLVVAAPSFASGSATGHYLLTDAEAIGGALTLKADGRYEWAASVGEVTLSRLGGWTQNGDAIMLSADNPEAAKGIAKIIRTEPWGDAAERQFLADSWSTRWEAVQKQCPLTRIRYPEKVAVADQPTIDWVAKARQALADRDKAHRQASIAVNRWAKTRQFSPEWDARAKTAIELMLAHDAATKTAEYANDRAGLSPLPWIPVILPDKCVPPKMLRPSDPLPPERHPQIGIVFGDPSLMATMVGIGVTLHYSDGSTQEAVSGPGGWIMVPATKSRKISEIVMIVDFETRERERVRLPTDFAGPGVLVIDIDPEALALRRYEPRRLTVDKAGHLRDTEAEAGTYVRS